MYLLNRRNFNLSQNFPPASTRAEEQLKSRRYIVLTGSLVLAFISYETSTNKSNYNQSILEEESSTRLSHPNSHPIPTDKPKLRTSIISKSISPPPPIRRNSIISQPPPPTTSIVPPLLPPPSTRRKSKLQTNQTIPIKPNSRVNKSKDAASKTIDVEVRKSEDDVIKNKYRSPAARKGLKKYISQITISNSLQK